MNSIGHSQEKLGIVARVAQWATRRRRTLENRLPHIAIDRDLGTLKPAFEEGA